MDELSCIWKSETRTEFSNVTEVEEGCLAEVVDVHLEREVGVCCNVHRYILVRESTAGDRGVNGPGVECQL